MQERKQFKKSIADFQATQFKLADMAGKIMSSRLMLRCVTCMYTANFHLCLCSFLLSSLLRACTFRQAAELLDQGHPAASAQCALAKKMATDQGKTTLLHSHPRLYYFNFTRVFIVSQRKVLRCATTHCSCWVAMDT